MPFLTKSPFIGIITPFALGIIASNNWSLSTHSIILYLFLLCLVYISFKLRNKPIPIYVHYAITTLLFFGIGLFISTHTNRSQTTSTFNTESYWIKATVIDIPTTKAKSYAIKLKVNSSEQKQKINQEDSKILAYFSKCELAKNLKPGDQLMAKVKFQSISPNLNPVGFNYAEYLAGHGIFHSVFIATNNWNKLNTTHLDFKSIALNTRQKIVDIYVKSGLQHESLAVFSALTIGYKNYLDPETKQAYSDSGAIHILAVSGMHVGIIMSIVYFILRSIIRIRNRNTILFILAISIWIYAIISGLSPSITRASIMATFILFGKFLNKRLSTYNSVAASAFFMLCINPGNLYNLGFQLSYSALLGILFFQKRFANLLFVPYRPLRGFWELTTVALSAQLGTFPLAIYYFNQLPFYFWLSGALIVCFAYILMLSAFVLIFLHLLTFDCSFIGLFIQNLTQLMNDFVFWIYQLPYATLGFFQTSAVQSILLYLMLGSVLFFIGKRKYVWLWLALSSFIGVITINSYKYYRYNSQAHLIVYHVSKETLIQYRHFSNSIWLSSDPNHYQAIQIIEDANEQMYISKNRQTIYSLNQNFSNPEFNVLKHERFLWLNQFKIMLLNENQQLPNSYAKTLHLDFIIAQHNYNRQKQKAPKWLNYNCLIIEDQRSKKPIDNLPMNANKTHYIAKQGAYIFVQGK